MPEERNTRKNELKELQSIKKSSYSAIVEEWCNI